MKLLPALLAAVLAAGCIRDAQDEPPPEEPLLPGGYKAVVDAGATDPGQFVVSDSADVVRFTTGPAGVAWRPVDVIGAGDVRVEATFHLHGAPVAYREAYGIFVGGQNMDSANVAYTYLMVRATGEFTIRTRTGSVSESLVEWTPHAAVQRVSQDGDEPDNTLVIQVRGGDADFLINDVRVFTMDAGELRPRGLAGVRVNHRLDVGLTSWSVGPPPAVTPDSTPSGL